MDEYAKLCMLLNDPHYPEVSRLLLHNTKSMLALPGQPYDLKRPDRRRPGGSPGVLQSRMV